MCFIMIKIENFKESFSGDQSQCKLNVQYIMLHNYSYNHFCYLFEINFQISPKFWDRKLTINIWSRKHSKIAVLRGFAYLTDTIKILW